MTKRVMKKNYKSISLLLPAMITGAVIIVGLVGVSKIFSIFDQIKNSPSKVMMILVAFALFYFYISKPRR